MWCQLVLEVQDEMQRLAMQLNPSLGQEDSSSSLVAWLERRHPAATHQPCVVSAPQAMACVWVQEHCGSSALLAGLLVCLCITSRALGRLLGVGTSPYNCTEPAVWCCVEAKRSSCVPPVWVVRPPASLLYYYFPLSRKTTLSSPPLYLR